MAENSVTQTSTRRWTDDGGPAFPTPFSNQGDLNVFAPTGEVVPPGGWLPLPGMTLRDYFAAQAMTAVGRTYFGSEEHDRADLLGKPNFSEEARRCYAWADAMLAERRR